MKDKKGKKKGASYSKQNPNYDIPSLPLHTSERTVLIDRNALSHLLNLNPKLGRGKVPFLRILPGTDPVEAGWGL